MKPLYNAPNLLISSSYLNWRIVSYQKSSVYLVSLVLENSVRLSVVIQHLLQLIPVSSEMWHHVLF